MNIVIDEDLLLVQIELRFPFFNFDISKNLIIHGKDCYKCVKVFENLSPYFNMQVPRGLLNFVCDDLSCLSSEGFYWLLPSYIRQMIQQGQDSDLRLAEFFFYHFIPSEANNPLIKRHTALISQAQKEIILQVLLVLKDRYPDEPFLEEIENVSLGLSL